MTSDEPTIGEQALTHILSTSSRESARFMLESEGYEPSDVEDLVDSISARMTMSSPPEIRASFPMVCSWHRWHKLLAMSMDRADVDRAFEAQKHIDALLRNIH